MLLPTENDLFVSDQDRETDFAIVFGSSNEEYLGQRASKACELYRSGLIHKVIFSGDARLAHPSGRSEASRMAELAFKAIPEEHLILEEDSQTTVENAFYCERIIRGSKRQPVRVGLITSAWHMFRVLMIAEHFFPATTSLVCLPTLEGCQSDNWNERSDYNNLVTQELQLVESLTQLKFSLPERFRKSGKK